MGVRRHPSGPTLGAWFDGEEVAAQVGGHVARCARCRRSVSEMAQVRSWIRAQPFFAMSDEEPAGDHPGHVWRARAVVASLLLVLTLLVVNAPRLRGPERASGGDVNASSHLFDAGTGEGPRASATTEPGGQAPPGTDARQRGAGSNTPSSRAPLRLGLVVPARGPDAVEGAEVAKTVRQRVERANGAGGVGGLPVELVVTAAEDADAVATLPKRVSVLVGGFGAKAPPGVPWLLPADPSVVGPGVVPAEASPEVAGQRIGDLLDGQDLGGPVGVVIGTGPESGLAAGLASKVPTTTVAAAPGDSCASEIDSLRRDGAVAIAVAGPPDLAARCLGSASRALWAPRFGTIVTPSAAYAGVHGIVQARGSRSVLGLPWPTAPGPGAARFRAWAGSRSYRALVSFAATELALDVAGQKGSVSASSVAGSVWRSDLFEVGGNAIRVSPVVASGDGWMLAPPIVPGPLLPPILPVPLPGLSS